MDALTYKAWRDAKLQQLKEVEAKVKKPEEVKKKEAEAAMPLSEHLEHIETRAKSAAAISVVGSPKVSAQYVPVDVLLIDSKLRTVLPEEGEDDVASPMHDSAYYAIPGYVVAATIKIKFLFLFLPRKENVRDAIGVRYWWSMMSLKESGWGPPSSMLKILAHLQKSPFYFSFCLFNFRFRKMESGLFICFYFPNFVLLVSQVIGRSAAPIKPEGCAPM
jgi:hypothetical protein